MSSLEQIKQLRIETKDEIDKIKDSDISDEDKKILISSHMKKFNDKFRKLNSNYDVKQFSSENNLVPSVNIFEQFNDLDIVGDFINKSFSEINSKVISNVNSNKIGAKSYNNMYSKSSSTSSFTDPEGVETVYKDKTETIDDLMDGKYFIMDTHYENICNTTDKNFNLFKRFQRMFDKRNKIIVEAQKKECELLLLNNR